jgi:serine/threonine protein kinase
MTENNFDMKYAEDEVNHLFIILHPNIASFKEHFTQKTKFYIWMEFMDDCDLESKLKARKTPFEEQVIFDVFTHLASVDSKM